MKLLSSSILGPLMGNTLPASIRLLLMAIFMPVLITGCASLSLGFHIGLRVSNPNRDPLSVDGLTYTLYLAGNKVVSGIGNGLQSIPAYEEGELKLRAVLSLFGV
ncbi:MAG: LEA14-like dessication related protein [Gammaproteobacteria bacterium]|jgi:LEA14-like dessication related protein